MTLATFLDTLEAGIVAMIWAAFCWLIWAAFLFSRFKRVFESFWSHPQLFASLGPSSFHSMAFWIFPAFWVPPGPCKEVGGGNGQELRRTPLKTLGCLDEDWLFWEITGSHTTWQVAYFLYILHLVGATVVGWETNGWELCHLFFSYSTVQRFWASNVLLLGRNNGLWFFLRSICFADFLEFLGFLIK